MYYSLIQKRDFSLFKKYCHIWHININNRTYIQSLERIDTLSNKEKEKLLSFKFDEDKRRYLVSHIALRMILTYYTSIPMNLIQFEYNNYGKPYLSNYVALPLFFNLSHTYNKALIGINNTEIGIDIEYIENFSDFYEAGNIIFSDLEYKNFLALKNYDEKLNYFYTIWTKKEAYLKALSIGLIDNLKEIHIGSETNSIIKNKFILQKINLNYSQFIAHIAFNGNEYKNILHFYDTFL